MKKIINVIVVFSICLVILFIFSNVYATTITLEQIVEKFNKSSIVDFYKNAGGSINATCNPDSITVTVSTNGNTENVEFLIKDNILSIEIDQEEESAFVKAYVAVNLIDAIGELYGYEEGELAETINDERAMNYTLAEEGYEIEKISESKFKVNVDITKKIPLLDFNDTYIKVDDLENLKKYISGDGSAEKSKGNIWFNKSGYDGEYTLIVAEKGNLTENTYKSILSILEVMFDNDNVIEKFKSNYPNISSGDKEFSGFSIKVNPADKTQWEEYLIPADSGYKFIRIIIDKSLAISDAKETATIEIASNKEDYKTQVENKLNLDTLPKTGEDVNVFLTTLYIIVGVCSIGVITILITKRKNNY